MPEFAKLQCKAVIESDTTLIVEDVSRVSILDLPPCKEILHGLMTLEYDGVVFRLLRRTDVDVTSP